MSRLRVSRRDILRVAPALALGSNIACTRNGTPPNVSWGVQSGDVTAGSATIWSRADRASRMRVELSKSSGFEETVRIEGPLVGLDTDFTGKVSVDGLPAGTRIHYRVTFDDSAPEIGSFGTPPNDNRDVLLAWSGDTNGQGWGIDPARGGMPAYAALLQRNPHLFIHCGDTIYADNPIPESITLPDNTIWKNVTDPMKTRVAETLEDFRGAHLYPRRCEEVRKLSKSVPLFSIWDDHEVRNNWFPGEILDDTRYREKNVDALAMNARRAMYEYAPTLRDPRGPMYRAVHWGPLLDVFLLDGRSYRTPNEPAPTSGGLLGPAQTAWLIGELLRSKAKWKVIACDMPIGVVVSEPGKKIVQANDGWANQNTRDTVPVLAPQEREIELARILSAIRSHQVKNVAWITADVHYCAAHHFNPAKATFHDFDPFWEFVAGPLHATAFPRKPTDDTFGCDVAWSSAGWDTFGSPATGQQHFGLLKIDGKTEAMEVTFVDARGRDIHRLSLPPA